MNIYLIHSEKCGQNAFAVIAKAWVPQDQSIPPDVASTLARRQDSPEVQSLTLVTNFESVDTSRTTRSSVNFAIRAANIPGAAGEIDIPAADTQQRRGMNSRVYQRGIFDFIGNAIRGDFFFLVSPLMEVNGSPLS